MYGTHPSRRSLLGRCHSDRSGFDGPWTRAPTTFSTEYYRELLENTWTVRKWKGPEQYTDPTGDLMMLPADMAMVHDSEFKKYVQLYAADEDLWFEDFANAWKKLIGRSGCLLARSCVRRCCGFGSSSSSPRTQTPPFTHSLDATQRIQTVLPQHKKHCPTQHNPTPPHAELGAEFPEEKEKGKCPLNLWAQLKHLLGKEDN
jgi:hypothetical protein